MPSFPFGWLDCFKKLDMTPSVPENFLSKTPFQTQSSIQLPFKRNDTRLPDVLKRGTPVSRTP
jgi:hypothetical protein